MLERELTPSREVPDRCGFHWERSPQKCAGLRKEFPNGIMHPFNKQIYVPEDLLVGAESEKSMETRVDLIEKAYEYLKENPHFPHYFDSSVPSYTIWKGDGKLEHAGHYLHPILIKPDMIGLSDYQEDYTVIRYSLALKEFRIRRLIFARPERLALNQYEVARDMLIDQVNLLADEIGYSHLPRLANP